MLAVSDNIPNLLLVNYQPCLEEYLRDLSLGLWFHSILWETSWTGPFYNWFDLSIFAKESYIFFNPYWLINNFTMVSLITNDIERMLGQCWPALIGCLHTLAWCRSISGVRVWWTEWRFSALYHQICLKQLFIRFGQRDFTWDDVQFRLVWHRSDWRVEHARKTALLNNAIRTYLYHPVHIHTTESLHAKISIEVCTCCGREGAHSGYFQKLEWFNFLNIFCM